MNIQTQDRCEWEFEEASIKGTSYLSSSHNTTKKIKSIIYKNDEILRILKKFYMANQLAIHYHESLNEDGEGNIMKIVTKCVLM